MSKAGEITMRVITEDDAKKRKLTTFHAPPGEPAMAEEGVEPGQGRTGRCPHCDAVIIDNIRGRGLMFPRAAFKCGSCGQFSEAQF